MIQKLRRRLTDMGTIKQLLEDAETIARRDGLAQPGAELEHGTVARTLQHLGLHPRAVREAATAEILRARVR